MSTISSRDGRSRRNLLIGAAAASVGLAAAAAADSRTIEPANAGKSTADRLTTKDGASLYYKDWMVSMVVRSSTNPCRTRCSVRSACRSIDLMGTSSRCWARQCLASGSPPIRSPTMAIDIDRVRSSASFPGAIEFFNVWAIGSIDHGRHNQYDVIRRLANPALVNTLTCLFVRRT